MILSNDAIIFGLAYLRGPKSKLSFGGEGAVMEITPRARAALDELLGAGYAETAKADDQIEGREHYQGTMQDPYIGEMVKVAGINPFDESHKWSSFSKKPESTGKPEVSFEMRSATR